MDRSDRFGVGAGEPRRDARAQVAAVSNEAPIAKRVGHDPVPQLRHLLVDQPASRRGAGETEPGQGRRHDGERVRSE
jgi:hypothetical protein